jgi:hypothetical protein
VHRNVVCLPTLPERRFGIAPSLVFDAPTLLNKSFHNFVQKLVEIPALLNII